MIFCGIRSLFILFFGLLSTAAAGTSPALPAHTDDIAQSISLADQRIHYEMAKSSLAKGATASFEKHYALLGDYPLTPYLEYAVLKQNLGNVEPDKIDSFFEAQKGSYLATRLRHQYLYTLAMEKRWADYLNYYSEANTTRELQCYWLYARVHEEDQGALEAVDILWPTGSSHPKACDPLFERWHRAGRLTQEIAWLRFHNAMQASNRSLARYLKRYLDDKHTHYADLYLKVHAYPYSMRNPRLFTEQSLPMQQIIAHGIKRYARKNSKDAMRFWEMYEAQQLFPSDLSIDAKQSIATYLIRSNEPALAEQLIASSRVLQQKHVIEALLRQALNYQNWEKVLQWVNALDEDAQSSDRWRYWRARALANLGLVDAKYGSAEHIYLSLSNNRSFYGFLAADRMGRSYSLQQELVEVSPATLETVEALPSLRRARELWLTQNFSEARAEWLFTTQNLDTDTLIAAGELARRWGWYNQGIQAMITGNLWNHLSIRFPLAYEDFIHQASTETSVTPDFIYAVARQESAFAEKAKSSAGAMGLMQLMPSTAKQTARRNGIKMHLSDLFKPEQNIQLGGLYLNELLEKYNGNRILAAAAYNAGPHRVNRWMEGNPEGLPYDVWIEIIPFKETRGYVQNVLAFSVIYGYRLGQPRALVSELEANSLL